MRRNRQDLVDEIGDAHGVGPGTTRSDRPPDIGIAEGSQAYTGQLVEMSAAPAGKHEGFERKLVGAVDILRKIKIGSSFGRQRVVEIDVPSAMGAYFVRDFGAEQLLDDVRSIPTRVASRTRGAGFVESAATIAQVAGIS